MLQEKAWVWRVHGCVGMRSEDIQGEVRVTETKWTGREPRSSLFRWESQGRQSNGCGKGNSSIIFVLWTRSMG